MRNNEEKVIALDLPPAKLDEPMQAYFAKCVEKLGFIPNVLKAYEFDLAKLKAFVDSLHFRSGEIAVPEAGAHFRLGSGFRYLDKPDARSKTRCEAGTFRAARSRFPAT